MTGKNFLRHSLGNKITLATLVIFVAGIWALSYYASRMLREDMESLLADQQFSTVSFVADELNDELKDRIHGAERIASLIDRPLLENPAALQKMLEGRPIFQDIFNAGAFAVSRDGTCIADVSKVAGRIGTNYSDYDAIHTALTEGKPAVGRPMMGKRQRQPVFTIAVPIRDAQGQVIGALAGSTNLEKPSFLDSIGKHRYGKSGGYLVIDLQHQLFVTATDKSRVMQPLPVLGINRMQDKYMQGIEGSGISVNSLGVEELSSGKRIPAAGWFVAATLPTEEAFAPIRDMQRRIMIAAIFLTLAMGILSWWLIRRQLLPLRVAVDKLAVMSGANQPLQPLPIAKHDEIGRLVGGFNHLLEIIGERETQLIAERDFFSALLRQSSDGVFLFDPCGLNILEANPSLCKMLGYERDEMLALKLTDLAEEPADGVREAVQWLLQSNQPFIAERNHLRKDGVAVATEVHGSVIMVGGRQLIMANIRDITERRKMSEKLLRLNRLYAVLSKTNEAIIRIQSEATLFDRVCHIAVEAGGFRMAWVGWIDEETCIVQPLVHVGHEDGYLTQITVKACKNELGRGATGTAIMDGRVAICNDIGNDPRMAPWRDNAMTRGYLSSASVPLKRGGEVVGAFSVYATTAGFFDVEVTQLLTEIGQDISFALDNMVHERNRLEMTNELQLLNENLEQRVAERTSQLEAANRELESFSYSVSHDLRAPLRAIDGFSRILADKYAESLDDKGTDYLGRIWRASKRMGTLIDDLLRLSQVSRAAIAKAKVDLSKMVQAIALELQSADPGRDVEWVIQEDGWAEGDPRLLRIVLENLVGNAWKFTAKQPLSRIEFGYTRQDNETVVFIKDNGAGFDMAYHNKLFGAFQRLHSADDFEGTGIGLATVQRIIQRHGGRIWAEGQVGAGATFYFALKHAGKVS